MKWIENHIGIVWALLVAWLISFCVVCDCSTPSRKNIDVVVVLLALGIVLFTIIIRYYKYNPKGREAIKRYDEAKREKEQRRRELIEEIERKYKGTNWDKEPLPPMERFDDTGMVF
jgi:sensor histidine kinase YesM